MAGAYVLRVVVSDDRGGSATNDLAVDVVTPGIVTSAANVDVPEGRTGTFDVKLAAQPAGNVTVTVARTAGDTNVTVSGGASLDFTTANWDNYQTVTITAPAGIQAYFAADTVAVNAGWHGYVPPVPEGGTTMVRVNLSKPPAGDVTVTVAWTSGDADMSVLEGATLHFNTTNWSACQNVVIAAAQDADTTNGTAILTCSAPGLTSGTFTATEADDDAILTVGAMSGGTTTPDGTMIVTKGAATTIGAVADAGYTFTNWIILAGEPRIANTNAANTTVTISAPATIRANFTIADPASDADGDGMSNADEITAGTDPTNRLSVLRFSGSALRAPGSELVIRWQSASNRWYTLQAASNLVDGFTLNLGTGIPATPPENVHTDSVEGAGGRFYRVRVE